MTARPIIKGWCPGAYRPMMSGDGLVVRVRPRLARLDRDQALGLASLSVRFGNGIIDLTSRANVQMRGVAEDNYQTLLAGLLALNLLDESPLIEARRNIVTTPFEDADGMTRRLHEHIVTRLGDLPDLPAKMGIALDTGDCPVLFDVSSDFRFERGTFTPLVLRADGTGSGRAVSEEGAMQALIEMAHWFVSSGGKPAGRMRNHLQETVLPDVFTGAAVRAAEVPLLPGLNPDGYLLGAAFGAVDAVALSALVKETNATGLRITPWRMFLLEGVVKVPATDFIDQAEDPRLSVHACPGAPLCDQAQIETRNLARTIAEKLKPGQSAHVSGCAKGCAYPHPSDLTIVGSDGRFDLVRHGTAWDEPSVRRVSQEDILKELT